MKKPTVTCPACGEAITIDPQHPQSFCPYCSEKLPDEAVTAAQKPGEMGAVKRILTGADQEAIPDLPTSREKKPAAFYVRQSLLWAGITAAFVGILMLLYGLAAGLTH